MWPTLSPGDEVLIAPHRPCRVGDVVVATHPTQADTVLIKRLTQLHERDGATLLGDNPAESTDSRTLGPIPLTHLLGPVTSRF